jgi:hypothetical protein
VDSRGKRAVKSDDCDCGDLKSQRPQGLIGVENGSVWNVSERDLVLVEDSLRRSLICVGNDDSQMQRGAVRSDARLLGMDKSSLPCPIEAQPRPKRRTKL